MLAFVLAPLGPACFGSGHAQSASGVPRELGCVPPSPFPDTCAAGIGARFPALLSGTRPGDTDASPPMGQMSEAAAHAKRLFDSERWAEAVEALQLVAAGQTGDDLATRQLAEYHLAISLYRLKSYRGAADLFVAIRAAPSHLKRAESLLWVGRLALDGTCPIDRVMHTLAKATDEEIARFDNPQQRALHAGLLHARARAELDLGDRSRAALDFRRVLGDERLGSTAQACLSEASR